MLGRRLIEKYGLSKQPFLTQIFEVRHKWAKPYFRDVFCAKMSSTQRSESANHMLKGYVPPGCPMHLFVKQYQKLQADRDLEECFQEKRTAITGAVLRGNFPIEIHASEVYTRNIFELFGKSLYESGQYYLAEVVPNKEFVLRHARAAAGEKWRKVEFKVMVDREEGRYDCECGYFEHAGLPCAHALKVMVHCSCDKIPERYVRDEEMD